MKIDQRVAESMTVLRAAGSAESPDAALILGCDRFEELFLKWKPAVLPRDVGRLLDDPEIDELIALGSALSSLQPISAAGRRAIGSLALMTLEAQGEWKNALASAAIENFMANDATHHAFPTGPKRKFKQSNRRQAPNS